MDALLPRLDSDNSVATTPLPRRDCGTDDGSTSTPLTPPSDDVDAVRAAAAPPFAAVSGGSAVTPPLGDCTTARVDPGRVITGP